MGDQVRRRRGLDLSVPFCPKCGSSLVQAWLPGPSMQILVDAARPEAGVLAVLVGSDDFPQGKMKLPRSSGDGSDLAACPAVKYLPRSSGD
ncbi:hypothetical protein [Streptomyces sp. ME19-01-6]|uniref:hypothetical protein n=1 Tax=Streptomyces sp. ME19-01-6 TaxID=3028686 RepID=UPI0029B683E6|nr:hypothetical protein [Streptomyces sp. ME19-01-6]MDX3232903.1 hypothetical protein [Streptomyces sp. ME19-01-6]